VSLGWFGEPWWSYVCYDEAGELLMQARVPFPEGESCMWCEEAFAAGDSGERRACFRREGPTVEHIHKECTLRMTVGCVAHLEGRCSCHGGADYTEPGLTKRQDALATWDWVNARKARAASD
jgi:hypothetical protein